MTRAQRKVKAVATAMQENGMQALGWNRVDLDDCWVDDRSSVTGKLTWDTSRFPSGIPSLAEWLHGRNFLFGLYTSAGNATCTGKVGSRGHYQVDAQSFADWGVDYVKLDWCGDIKKQILDGKKAHEEFAQAMNATGRPMFIEVVAGYFFLGKDISHVANSWRFCVDHHDTWKSTKAQLECLADQVVESGPGGWASMDFLHTGGAGCSTGNHCPGQTDDEYKTEFVIWSLTQSPLFIDTDLRNMTSIMKTALLNKELIDLHSSTATLQESTLGTGPSAKKRWPATFLAARPLRMVHSGLSR